MSILLITDQIISDCQRGDPNAQRLVYQALSVVMLGVMMRYASSRAQGEDWLHDGFIQLFDKIGSYRSDGSFEGWARRVFVTTALTHLRRDKKWRNKADGGELGWVESGEASAIKKMHTKDVLRIINRLPTTQRTVLNLYCIEGYGHDEIAGMLSISPQNSRTILHRAKTELAAMLRSEGVMD